MSEGLLGAREVLRAAVAAAGGTRPAPLSWTSEVALQGLRLEGRAYLASERHFRWELGGVTLQASPSDSWVARGEVRHPILPDDEERLAAWTWLRGAAPFAGAEPLEPAARRLGDVLRVAVRSPAGTRVELDFDAATYRWAGASYEAVLGDRRRLFTERLARHAALDDGTVLARERTLACEGVAGPLVCERIREVARTPLEPGAPAAPADGRCALVDVPPRTVATLTLDGSPAERGNDAGRAAERLMAAMRTAGLETLVMPALTHLWHVARTRYYSSPLGLFELTFLRGYVGGAFSAESRVEVTVPAAGAARLDGEGMATAARPAERRAVLYARQHVRDALLRFDALRAFICDAGYEIAGPAGVTLCVDGFYRDAMVHDAPLQAIHYPVVPRGARGGRS